MGIAFILLAFFLYVWLNAVTRGFVHKNKNIALQTGKGLLFEIRSGKEGPLQCQVLTKTNADAHTKIFIYGSSVPQPFNDLKGTRPERGRRLGALLKDVPCNRRCLLSDLDCRCILFLSLWL